MKTQEKPRRAKKEPSTRNAKPGTLDNSDWTWADPKTLKVNPEFQRLIPLQSREEYRALNESIQAEGCRDPLTVWKGHNVVLDGHTRRDLCIEHKKQVKLREVELSDDKAATAFILQIQRQRRNLTREAMSYFRGVEYNAVKQARGGDRRGRRPKEQSVPMDSTAQQLARKYGVSDMTVKRDGVFAKVIDKIVAEYGDPEVKRHLLGADVKLSHGLARLVLKMPAEEQKAAVKQLIELGELPRAKKGSTATAPKPNEMAQSLIARLNKKGEGTAQAVFKQMARLLGFEVAEKAEK